MIHSFDEKQTEAISFEKNSVVMAGAGSGKTSVISERYCWLLEKKGIGVKSLLALTFTQKAAAEMYERIYNRLLRGPAGLQRHLEAFEQAQISTLDSFCAEIVSNACDRFGLPQDFHYDEQAVSLIAEQVSLEFLLENLENPVMQELLHIHGFETLWKDLFADLARNHLHLPGENDFPAMVRAQIDRCQTDLMSELRTARDLIDQISKLDPRTVSIQRTQETLAGFESVSRYLAEHRYSDAEQHLARLVLRKPGGRGAEDMERLKGMIDSIRPALKNLSTLASTLSQEKTLLGFFALLEIFNQRFVEKKRTLGLVTFQDVEKLAVQALVRDKPLRQFYKHRYRYIMIDEFQDNNRLQKDLLFLLAEKLDSLDDGVPLGRDLEPDKLFFVGDEKQSIYRFRGAEVSVFKSLRDELTKVGGSTVDLDRNYRSESGLIEFVNTVFAVVMADAKSDYEAGYQRMRKGGADNSFSAQIHLLYGSHEPNFEQSQAFPADNLAEAYSVVRFIHETVEKQNLSVASEGELRPATYDDFAVLLRSTSNQIHFERMFRHFSVPYSTDNLRSLFTEAPINDIYLWLQLAIYPADRAAYAGTLRSPLVNIGDENLIRFMLTEKNGPRSDREPDRQPFSETDSFEMGEEDRRRLEKGKEIYTFLRESADRVPIAELFHSLWYRFGYRYTILQNPHNHNYLEYYDYMIKLAERADRQGDSLAVFLDFLRQNLGKYERLEDLPVLKPRLPGVQLLTIHRSKGLEFPIVVLADTGSIGRHRGNSSPYYISSQYGITVNLGSQNYFTDIGEKESEKEDLAEIKRLLYVALTRAQAHLVVAGTHKQKNRKTPRAHLNLLLRGLGLSEDTLVDGSTSHNAPYQLTIHKIGAPPLERLYGRERPRTLLPLKHRDALYERQPIQRQLLRQEVSVTEVCRHLEPLLEQRRREAGLNTATKNLPSTEADILLKEYRLEPHFGILTHRLLDLWSRNPAGPPPEPEWTRTGVPKEYRDVLFSSAVTLCRKFFSSELGALALEARRIDRELPFLYLCEDGQDSLYISGQIDLAFEYKDHLYLIDFKTDRIYRPGEHEAQLGLYRLALEEQTEKEIFTFLFLLRSGEAIRSAERIDLIELVWEVRRLL
jgi:ATP-dependent exoDNAse (exonuclease V) beta subunit